MSHSLLQKRPNPCFFRLNQGVSRRPSFADFRLRGSIQIEIVVSCNYSAAKASVGFMFAADIMKSEMRGTISDLKREPLKTP